jgi:hypothetical protein
MLNQLISIRVDRRSQRQEFLKDPWQEAGGCAKIMVIEGLFLQYDGQAAYGLGLLCANQ